MAKTINTHIVDWDAARKHYEGANNRGGEVPSDIIETKLSGSFSLGQFRYWQATCKCRSGHPFNMCVPDKFVKST